MKRWIIAVCAVLILATLAYAASKVSELTALSTADSADVLMIVDTSASESKQITVSNLLSTTGTSAAVALNTTHRTDTGTDHTYIDQDVTSGASPTFTGTNFTGIPAQDHGGLSGLTDDDHTQYLKEADFDATTFMYATSDNTPQAKTPAETRAILNASNGELIGKLEVEASSEVTLTVSTDTHYGGIAVNSDADAQVQELKAAVVGMSIMSLDGAGGAITLDPNGTNTMTYNGTTAAAGEALISSGAKGDFISLICVVANQWIAIGHDSNGWTEASP